MINFLNKITITRKVALLITVLSIEFLVFLLDSMNSDDNTDIYYISILSITFTITIGLSINILKSIKELIVNLNAKTNELKNLNSELQNKVRKEVEKNREKDQIMYQHSRLAAMGEMVGNIAHQWRQPLNAMTVLIQSFAVKNMTGKLTDEFIDKQVDEGLRLSKIMSDTIDDFRSFFIPNKSREYFDIKVCIENTINLVQEKNIDITIKCHEKIKIYSYQNEFSQVILNFLNNSIDSFNLNKTKYDKNIFIEIKKVLSTNNDIEKKVMITFVDNAGGIDESIIDRIFEPYFTTKHKSTGTGIGLYMSKQIIEKQMKGNLEAKNIIMNFDHNSYKCAKFEITIPITEYIVTNSEKILSIA